MLQWCQAKCREQLHRMQEGSLLGDWESSDFEGSVPLTQSLYTAEVWLPISVVR